MDKSTTENHKNDDLNLEEGKPTLFSFWLSSCSWRVRIVLNLKKLDYNYVASLFNYKNDAFFKLNPTKLVPALYVDGHLITESIAICQYLDETRPCPVGLMPKNPYQRALVRQVCEQINAGIQPMQNLKLINKLGDEYNADKVAWCNYWNVEGLAALDKILARTAGKYSVGDELTIADAFLVPQAWAAFIRFNIDRSTIPNIARVYDTLIEIPEIKDAAPDKQPDYDPEQMKSLVK